MSTYITLCAYWNALWSDWKHLANPFLLPSHVARVMRGWSQVTQSYLDDPLLTSSTDFFSTDRLRFCVTRCNAAQAITVSIKRVMTFVDARRRLFTWVALLSEGAYGRGSCQMPGHRFGHSIALPILESWVLRVVVRSALRCRKCQLFLIYMI